MSALACGVGAAAAVAAGVALATDSRSTASMPTAARASTAAVERGRLSAAVAQTGTLTYRARPDGSPYLVFNRASGTYTALPEVGDRIGCGEVLYRVDDDPVLLLCGAVPAYRPLRQGDHGRDVRQLNENLRALGADAQAKVDLRGAGASFTWQTRAALKALQRRRGSSPTGQLAAASAAVLPGPVRVARRSGQPGGAARPGAAALQATSTALQVRVELPAYQRRQVRTGARARIVLPGSQAVGGRVSRVGRVAPPPVGKDGPAAATVPVDVRLDSPGGARGFAEAPVQVEIQTAGVSDALSVPVTALVGRPGGGFAVERVGAGGAREPVAVRLGLFDSAGGRVQVEGDLRVGDQVVVPSL